MRKTWKLFGITIKRVVSNQIFKADYVKTNRIYEGFKPVDNKPKDLREITKDLKETFNPDLKPNHESIMRPTCEGDKPSCSELV